MSKITAGTMKAARELLRVTARGELLWNHKGVDTEGKRKFAETGDVMWCDAEDVIVEAIRRARGE